MRFISESDINQITANAITRLEFQKTDKEMQNQICISVRRKDYVALPNIALCL